MPADLHLHTYHSDGSWSPAELVDAAIKQGLKCIAITDHDTTAGIAEAVTHADGRIEIIQGIEINTVHIAEDGTETDVHLLGYFIDVTNNALKNIIERQQEARRRLVEDTIARCNSLGIGLTAEHVLQSVGNGSIGRPHLARAIVKAGGAETIAKAFERFMHRQSADFIARLAVPPQDAIAAIQSSGGISSIAHPGKNERMVGLIKELQACGLGAIECYHRSHGLETVKHYLRLAATSGMLVTGGSDCHGPSGDGHPASIGSVKVPLDVVHNLKAALQVSA